jgi:hypothetical protein
VKKGILKESVEGRDDATNASEKESGLGQGHVDVNCAQFPADVD